MIMLKKIAIQCDLNKTSGLGHLSRMKNLSQELEKKGFKCFFLFPQKDRNYIVRFTENLKTIFFSGENKINSISHFLLENNFLILIIDSYENNFLLEKNLVQKGLFVVSIDDHSRKHYSNIVVNNSIDKINLNKKKNKSNLVNWK